VIRTLRRNHATTGVPIIVLSGSHSERHSLYALVLGANAFIAKPAEPQALVREILRILGPDRVR
jgi:DNA-binding response OmpR family regulator